MLKNAATYMAGSVVAQLLMLAAIPVLSRLYTPDDFGVFGLYSSLLGIFGVAACLRLELAITLPKNKRQAAQVLAAGAMALATTSVIVLIMVAIGRTYIADLLQAPQLENLLWLLPISLFGYGLYELLNYWATRHGRFKSLAISHVLRAGGVTGTQVASVALIGGALGLALGQLVGQWITNLVLAWQTLRWDRGVLVSGFKISRILRQARRYRSFPVHGAPQAILNSASQAIPAIMLGWLFNPAILGFYIMAQRIVSAPMALVSQALRQAMLPYFSRQNQTGSSLRPILWKCTSGLALIGLPVMLTIFFFGENLFVFILGDQWRTAGIYSSWLAPWLWAGMINPPSTIVLTALEQQRTQLLFEITLISSRIIAIGVGGINKSPETAIILFSATGTLFNLSLLALADNSCRRLNTEKQSMQS